MGFIVMRIIFFIKVCGLGNIVKLLLSIQYMMHLLYENRCADTFMQMLEILLK